MADSPAKLLAIVRREYLERVRSKWFVIGTVFGPLLLAGFAIIPVMLARSSQTPTRRVLVVDATGGTFGRYVARALGAPDASGSLQAELRVVTPADLARAESSATEEVRRRLANGYVVLDSAALSGGPVRYAGRQAESRAAMARFAAAVRTGRIAMTLAARGLAQPALDSVIAVPAPALRAVSITDAGPGKSNVAKALLAAFVAFFLYAAIVFYGQSMLTGVIEEKLTRMAEIVVSSVRPETLLAGKVLGISAVGITQTAIWIAGTVLILTARTALFGAAAAPASPASAGTGAGGGDFLAAVLGTPWSWVLVVVLFFLLGFVFYGALYAAVGATVGSESEARQAAQPVVLLLVLTAVFISPVMIDPGSTIARVMSLLPFSSPIIMPLRMAIIDVPAWEVAASLALLALGGAGAVWLAARIYRVGLLMYGKRPSLRELRRWIAAG